MNLLRYLRFLLKSTNHHGVHSPFVFDYVTKCLYTRPRISKNKLDHVVLKSISYFDYRSVYCQNNELARKLHKSSTRLEINNPPYDLVILSSLHPQNLSELFSSKKSHNNSMFVIPSLQKNWLEWQKFIRHPEVTVSIDCFYLGILFIRKEQVKEHFTIRL